MAAHYFNSLGGFSAGLPEVAVVDANGNVVTNVNTLGNVTANIVYAGSYKFANGANFVTTPGGNLNTLQFNNNGSFGGASNVTFANGNLSLGNVSNVKISGGLNGYFLQTDGSGNLTWAPGGNGGSGGNGVPGGANTQIQFNNGGNFGGNSGFTFTNTTGVFTAPSTVTTNLTTTGNVSLGNVSNVKITGGYNGYVLTTDGTGNLSWAAGGNGTAGPGGANSSIQFNNNGLFAGANGFTYNSTSGNLALTGSMTVNGFTANAINTTGNVSATGNVSGTYLLGNGAYISGIMTNTANYVVQPVQSNITTVGTLGNLNVSGNVLAGHYISAANIQTAGAVTTGTLSATSNVSVSGVLSVGGNVTFSTSANVNLGNLSNITIAGGLNGYVIQTDGFGNLIWAPQGGGGGGGGFPGGQNTDIQFNSNGNFAGSSYFTYNNANQTVQIAGNLIANAIQLGSGTYAFGYSSVYFATTSTTAKTSLWSIPVANCSGVGFEIIGTDSVDQKRQYSRLNSLYYAGTVSFSEYGDAYINGGVATFSVEYNAGNVTTAPTLVLYATPDTTNNVVYKMWITVLAS